jgi:diguanylate cyclase (GGDEF)-like protein
MKRDLLKTHFKLVLFAITMIAVTLGFTLSMGVLKPSAEIDVTDMIGEGGIVAVTLMWLVVTLVSRPAGQLTNLMTVGLVFMHISVLADFLDEFLRYDSQYWWISAYESIPAPIGMILMSIALYQWHQEQMQINQQLRKREFLYREHGLIDFITGLYGAQYMQKQLDDLLLDSPNQDIQMLMVDVDYFEQFIQQHGDHAGDRVLRELSELFLMNLRTTDLLCRYAGDRFIMMLTDSNEQQANIIQTQLEQALAGVSIKPANSVSPINLSFTLSHCSKIEFESAEQAFSLLNARMEKRKQQRTEVA